MCPFDFLLQSNLFTTFVQQFEKHRNYFPFEQSIYTLCELLNDNQLDQISLTISFLLMLNNTFVYDKILILKQ